MPNAVESFRDVTKNSTNLFTFIKSFGKRMINISKLINSRVIWNKSRLKRRDKVVFMEEVEDMFMYNSFNDFADSTKKRDRPIVTHIMRIFLFMNCTNMG